MIRTIAVVGDGIAGWSAAAALKKRVPGVSVALVPVTGLRPGFVDLCGGAAPSIGEFHRDIGLEERDVVARTGTAFRLGTRFVGWGERDYVHGYGPAGRPIDGAPFASLWARDGHGEPYDAFAPAAVLARAGRFVPAGDGVLGGYAHGLQLDLPVYRRFIEAYARHLGVVVTAGGFEAAEMHGDRVERLRLDDGGDLTADLYVDATNADARLIGGFGDPWEDWSAWLPCDTIVRSVGPADPSLPPIERVEAIDGGWRMTAFLPTRTETTLCTRGASDGIGFRSGRRRRAWIGNVVAIGEAHMVVEPLEGAPLHVLHTQIDRLVASLPDRDFALVELANYDRGTNEEADRLRDFLILHHAPIDPPPLLAETLALFSERGRLPIRDGESFDRDSWHAVLFGQGVIPRRSDVLAARIDPARVRAEMAAFSTALTTAVAAAPTHRDYLARLRA